MGVTMPRDKSKPVLYYKVVDGDSEIHLRETTRNDWTCACVIHIPASGSLPQRKRVEYAARMGLARRNANQYRCNGTVVDIVPAELVSHEEYLDLKHPQA